MKTLIITLATVVVLGGCTKRTDTEVTTDGTGTVETSTTSVSTTIPTVDTAEVRDDAAAAGQATEDAARKAAQKTGTALEEAGKDIQDHAKPGNQP